MGLLLAFLGIVGVYSVYMPSRAILPTTTITVGGIRLEVELATTDADRQQGLSSRTSLSIGKGMLFVFDGEGKWGIWMKDMRFSIDIIWADINGTIVTIEHDVSPASYPNSFYPSAPAEYVLEVPAGYAKKHDIGVGTKIVVQ